MRRVQPPRELNGDVEDLVQPVSRRSRIHACSEPPSTRSAKMAVRSSTVRRTGRSRGADARAGRSTSGSSSRKRFWLVASPSLAARTVFTAKTWPVGAADARCRRSPSPLAQLAVDDVVVEKDRAGRRDELGACARRGFRPADGVWMRCWRSERDRSRVRLRRRRGRRAAEEPVEERHPCPPGGERTLPWMDGSTRHARLLAQGLGRFPLELVAEDRAPVPVLGEGHAALDADPDPLLGWFLLPSETVASAVTCRLLDPGSGVRRSSGVQGCFKWARVPAINELNREAARERVTLRCRSCAPPSGRAGSARGTP